VAVSPFCNVVTLTVTQVGGMYRLEGYDDQCSGSGPRAAAVGLAVPNPEGSIGFGLTVVGAPGGTPSHLDIALNLATLGGSWRDQGGNAGSLVFNPAEVQVRVAGACPAGQFMRSVNADGTVQCSADGTGTGDITGVSAGTGLSGGGTSGEVALAVAFGGSGAAATAARSDHAHVGMGDITAVNPGAGLTGGAAAGDATLAVRFAGSGDATTAARSNHTHQTGNSTSTAIGNLAMSVNTGSSNTGIGSSSLFSNTSGGGNTAVGADSLRTLNGGGGNTAIGYWAGRYVQGNFNIAIGAEALQSIDGDNNIAIGRWAGDWTSGASHNNVYLANPGRPGLWQQSNRIRIGFDHQATFARSSSATSIHSRTAARRSSTGSSRRRWPRCIRTSSRRAPTDQSRP
jgi:hypothetical protein